MADKYTRNTLLAGVGLGLAEYVSMVWLSVLLDVPSDGQGAMLWFAIMGSLLIVGSLFVWVYARWKWRELNG